MTKKKFLLETDYDLKEKKFGRPKIKEPSYCFSNIPFTEEEHFAIEKIKLALGGDKRHWIKKWIQEGIDHEFKTINAKKL
jgi:hypothetical protein